MDVELRCKLLELLFLLFLVELEQETGSLDKFVLDVKRWVVHNNTVLFKVAELLADFVTCVRLTVLLAGSFTVGVLGALCANNLLVLGLIICLVLLQTVLVFRLQIVGSRV